MESSGSPRRRAIVAAAFECIATHGYDRTSTATICRRAGVSSGTFFHHFKTKSAVLTAVLEDGLQVTRQLVAECEELARTDPSAALRRWAQHVGDEARDPQLPGFVAALGNLPEDPGVEALLVQEADLLGDCLGGIVTRGQQEGSWRTDRSAEQLAAWLRVLAEGVLALSASGARDQPDPADLADLAERLLRPS